MSVKRLKTIEEVAKLLGVQDDVGEYFPCGRGEWVQWLVSQADNERFAIWANFDEAGKIDSYIVALDNIEPPISDSLFIPYAWSVLGQEQNEQVLAEVVKWGKERGAKRIRAMAVDPEKLEKYGFSKRAEIMELEI